MKYFLFIFLLFNLKISGEINRHSYFQLRVPAKRDIIIGGDLLRPILRVIFHFWSSFQNGMPKLRARWAYWGIFVKIDNTMLKWKRRNIILKPTVTCNYSTYLFYLFWSKSNSNSNLFYLYLKTPNLNYCKLQVRALLAIGNSFSWSRLPFSKFAFGSSTISSSVARGAGGL